MDVLLSKIVFIWGNVRFSCKAGQSLLVNVDPHRTYSTEKDIDSKIEFKSFNEKWPGNVLLNNIMRPILHLFDPLGQKDPSSLAICLRFHDEGLLFPNELLP